MKKIMMTLAAVAVAATMNAQVYLGGTLGFNMQNKLVDQKDGGEATGMTFQIKPEIGYMLSENMAVGAVLGFGVSNNSNSVASVKNGEEAKAWNSGAIGSGMKYDKSFITFEIAPYFRYIFAQTEKVNFFFDAQVGFKYYSQDEWNATQFTVGVVPGVAVNLNEKVSFVAKLGDGLGFRSFKAKESDAQSTFGLDLKSLAGLQFGLYYNF